MHQTESADYIRIGKLAVEVGELGSQHQSFVDDSSARKRGNVKRVPPSSSSPASRISFSGAFAHDIQLALESIFVKAGRAVPTKICWMYGCERGLHGQSPRRKVGVSLSPKPTNPPSAPIRSRIPSQRRRACFSTAGNVMPNAVEQESWQLILISRTRVRRTYAESDQDARSIPGLSIAPKAPPVPARLQQHWIPSEGMSSALLAADAGHRNPIPQASCSCAGSYRPLHRRHAIDMAYTATLAAAPRDEFAPRIVLDLSPNGCGRSPHSTPSLSLHLCDNAA